MTWLAIGVLVGVVMGLTGAGGAIISIPLFTMLLGVEFKQATIIALLVVIVASLTNWLLQFRKTHFVLSLSVSILSFAGTFLFRPLKEASNDFVIFIIFAAICSWSLWSIWKPQTKKSEGKPEKNISYYAKIFLSGILMGFSSVMTGVGGGIFLIPVLLNTFKLKYAEAVPTSLFSILLGAICSLAVQHDRIAGVVSAKSGSTMVFGVVVASFALKRALRSLSAAKVDSIRKWAITGVILLANIVTGIQHFG